MIVNMQVGLIKNDLQFQINENSYHTQICE